ncbi:MAG: glycerophosphodiester phosphodiesterase [Acidimicrobiales bacterium]
MEMSHPWPVRSEGDPIAVLAHRGGTGAFRENTVAAFEEALGAGADGVELDVRRSADGVLVVHHDPDVAGTGPIHLRRADELPDWLPSLGAALAACAGASVNVEIKNSPIEPAYEPGEETAAQAAAMLQAMLGAHGAPVHCLVTSFWPATLKAVRSARSSLITGLLIHPSMDAAGLLDEAMAIGCGAVLPFRSQVTSDLVCRAHEGGLAVVAWTVNDPAGLEAVAGAGVDAVITDHVREALLVLGRS